MPEEVIVPDGGDGQPPVAPPAKKLAYTDEQQEHLNGLINDAYTKAFKKAEENVAPKLKALEDQIIALKATPPKEPAPKEPVVPDKSKDPDVLAMKARLDEMETVAKQLREEKEAAAREAAEQRQRGKRTRVKEEFIRASGNKEFFDPMDVFNLVQDQLELDDATDRVVITNPNTKLPRQSVSGNMTLDEFLTDFAKAKPHMVRSKTAAGGTGSEEQRRLPADGAPPAVDYSKLSSDEFKALADKVISDGYRKRS